ncbi:MAG: type II toxin-antitoxin system prevent-host-death family antitoxin [Thermaerobacter sp.]|nr:type II toxin-antitoxin system prevent-host-death family antitoxin [Thermaerobacter sp.]
MTHVGIRLLKRQLSQYVARARSGDVIVVTDRGQPVARLGPLKPDPQAAARELAAQYGIPWEGGAPRGVPLEEAAHLDEAHALSRAISEDRG